MSRRIEKQFKSWSVTILTATKGQSIADGGSQVTVTVTKHGARA